MFKPNLNTMKKKHLFSFLLLLAVAQLFSQQTFPRNGVYDERDGAYAFTNATIHTTFERTIKNATLIIRKGKIEAVGTGLTVPKAMVTIDLKGKHIYPSFVDIYTDYGVSETDNKSGGSGWSRTQQMISNKSGAYMWNQALQPEFRAHEHFTVDEKAAKGYREIGFGVVSAHRMDGMSRGTATVVTLGEDRPHKLMLREHAAHHLSFKKGTSTQSYPGSLMGGIALFRQTYLDGDWYKNQKEEINLSLAAWNDVQSLPQVFETREILESLRAIKLGKTHNHNYIIYGNGDEYQRLEKIKKSGNTFIINLNFPQAFDVEAPYDALRVELGDMKHWELAPTNPGVLAKNGVNIILTSHGLKDKKSFLKNLRKAIESGLSEEQALKALTQSPAKALNVYDQVGSLEKGKLANFFITSDEIFAEKTKIHHHWIQGKPFIFSNPNAPEVAGKYDLKVGEKTYQLQAEDDATMKIVVNDSTSVKVKSSIQNEVINLSFQPDKEIAERISLTGVFSKDLWSGNGTNRDGSWTKWSAVKIGDLEKEETKDEKKEDKTVTDAEMGAVIYPFMAFGNKTLPKAETVLIRNATVWTNEDDGILENADVLFTNGKIKAVGKSLPAAGATIIDGTGKHVTSGVIDEHSHIAISRGVNECTQASTAEVSIADVVDSEDIDIYRQLAGGVTTSQLLHGSCNPIGGKSAIIKLRWGYAPEEMKMENSPGFIKFALGENVKKSRSSSNNRFPDTRMGVEQVYVDAFTRAKEYQKKRNQPGFRKDLDLETLLEIMEGKRHISCHSYVQSEINMLMHVADDMGFKVNTFTHILEGYKVADKMKAHGAGGSSFSDWWAYKYEVIDAIPYNGALMHEQGVTVAFNSDDSEMARRLNQEAAKAVKYGQVSEEDAWKFVTLNPAKLLHIDDRVGSIKAGKDADIVVWSDHPMSIYAKAEQTFIDGIRFFDRNEDQAKQLAVQRERTRLINKMLEVKKGGGKTRPVGGKMHRHYHCDDAEDEMHD